ncbi:Site-specific recombinase XerD [Tenacibaculum sp. MAR_2010_89]|uniref:tyrosine-type recombinase/integrase n=1 Tax=Tenacibaculum sp. MAR_2010_89 TaxID=1250198 RepID=UPI0008963327|nr:site-specific integrase [Tenacibaculum sp. MAR_2010_89]SEE58137.1 Site-specific recombinase XerD [Tenacibaculum sp. MAR_2010_89]
MNFSLQLRSYKKKNQTQAIRLRFFTNKNDIQYIDTKISVLKNQWDSKKQVVKKHPLEESLNAKLNALLTEVKKVHYKNEGASAKRLLQIYKNTKQFDTSSFLDFYQSLVDEMILKEKIRSANTTQKYISKLKKYSSHISFSDLSVNWATDYENYLLKKGNKINTIASNFKSIYSALNKAIKLGLINSNPIKGYKIVVENVEKESLSLEEIEKVINLEIHPRHKGMIKARDIWLFSFYTAGMRFTDICQLKWINIIGNDIVYTMNKAKTRSGSRRTIPLNPKSIEILEKYKNKDDFYVFPPLYNHKNSSITTIEHRIYITNNNLNRALKIIAKQCDINKPISMHMAKHSFTDYAVKSDVGLLMISKLLGHTKLSTTQHYLKDFYHKEESDTINKLFG